MLKYNTEIKAYSAPEIQRIFQTLYILKWNLSYFQKPTI